MRKMSLYSGGSGHDRSAHQRRGLGHRAVRARFYELFEGAIYLHQVPGGVLLFLGHRRAYGVEVVVAVYAAGTPSPRPVMTQARPHLVTKLDLQARYASVKSLRTCNYITASRNHTDVDPVRV